MAEETDVIRAWLETNFATELKKGDEAVQRFRQSVAQMGPDVQSIFQKIDNQVAPAVDKLAVAAGKAAGKEAEGIGFAGMSRGAFMAERAIGALATGQGLARAGPMLEGLIGLMGGPAGMGFMIGSMALAAEKYIPMLVHHFDLGGTEAEKAMHKTQEALDKAAEHFKQIVEKMENTPSPRQAAGAGRRKGLIDQLFNEETLHGPAGLEMNIGAAVKGAGLAGASAAQQKELDDLEKERADAFGKSMAMSGAGGPGHTEDERKAAEKVARKAVQSITDKIQGIQETIIADKVRALMGSVGDLGEAGKTARKQLKDLAKRFPRLFTAVPDFIKKLDDIDRDQFGPWPANQGQGQGRGKGKGAGAAAPNREQMERDQAADMEAWQNSGFRSHREAIEWRMEQRDRQMNPENYEGDEEEGNGRTYRRRRPYRGHYQATGGRDPANFARTEGMVTSGGVGLKGMGAEGGFEFPKMPTGTPPLGTLGQYGSKPQIQGNLQLNQAVRNASETLQAMQGATSNQEKLQAQLNQQRAAIQAIRQRLHRVSGDAAAAQRDDESFQQQGGN